VTRFASSDGRELPEEFCPPEKAAECIAALSSIAEREAYYVRIPRPWQPMIGDLVVPAIARRICGMRDKFDRQNAIASVPELWREQVKQLVMSWWATRHLRAEVVEGMAA